MEENKNSMLNRIIEALSAIFLPIINVVTAAGVTKGFLALFVSLGWVESGSGTYIICSSMADSLFYFLPIFIAFTSANCGKSDSNADLKFSKLTFSNLAIFFITVFLSL